MLIVGLTGSIASGKNSAAHILSAKGARIIDADRISRELVTPGSVAWHEIVEYFGPHILDREGKIDRKKLGRTVFSDGNKRERLNAILHPKIIAREWQHTARIKESNPEALVVINAALLIESGNVAQVDTVVLVLAEDDTVMERMMKRDGLSAEEAKSRLDSQMPQEAKKKYADYVIENNGTLPELEEKMICLMEKLKKRYAGRFRLAGDAQNN